MANTSSKRSSLENIIKYDSLLAGNKPYSPYWLSGIYIDQLYNANQEIYGLALDASSGSLYLSNFNASLSIYGSPQLTKFDSSGSVVWQRNLTSDWGGYPNRSAVDTAGNAYLAINYMEGLNCGVFAKYNSSGVLQWQRGLAQTGNSGYLTLGIEGITTDSAGNIYISGVTYHTSPGSAFVAKYDSTGALTWQRFLLGTGHSNLRGIGIDSSSNVYVAGYTRISNNARAFVAKYNSAGTIQWQRILSSGNASYEESFNNMTVTSNGNVYLVGDGSSSFGYYRIIAKYNTSGTIQWQRTIGDQFNDYGWGIGLDSSENVYTCSTTEDGPLRYCPIAKHNSSGTLQWQRRFTTGTGKDNLKSVTLDTSGNMYFGAQFEIPDSKDKLSVGIIKLPSDGTNIGNNVLTSYITLAYGISYMSEGAGTLTDSAGSLTDSAGTLTSFTSSLVDSAGNLSSARYPLTGSLGTTPNAPTIGTATAINSTTLILTFTAPAWNGGQSIQDYNLASSPTISDLKWSQFSWGDPTIAYKVTGTFVANTAYTFTVAAANIFGLGSASSASNSVTPNVTPVLTGGTLSTDGYYNYRTFTANGTLSVSNTTAQCDILVVAGGGGGTNAAYSGGGGGGGLIWQSAYNLAVGSYAIAIGNGGAAGASGSNTTFGSIFTAVGGGSGTTVNGTTGGSGGGAGGAGARTGGSATSGQGNAGGNGISGSGGAGGGGYSSAGSDGNYNQSNAFGGSGGIGLYKFGTMYSAGGGGYNGDSSGMAVGGAGGTQGQGYSAKPLNATSGNANTGNGGGGGSPGASGGSGIVIVRYLV